MHMRSLLCALVLCCTGVVCAQPQPRSIVILHTNDIHASFVPHEAVWVRSTPKPLIGGFEEISLAVDSIRNANPEVLLLDAGDVMTGNPIADLEYDGAQGGALFAMMNMIGYDAWCPGNHDLDISQENLIRLTRIARFPTLSANLVKTDGEYAVGNQPYAIMKRGGVRIGIIGVMSQYLSSLVNQNNLTGIKVLSPIETTQKWIDTLREKTDLRIALTHQGVEEDSILAAHVSGLDIIVGGHSHTRLKTPKVVHGVIIVQAGSNAEQLGVLTLHLSGQRIDRYEGRLLPLWSRPRRTETPVSALVDSVQHVIDLEYNEVLATLKGDWMRGRGESDIGNFIAKAQQEAAGAEIGFMNTHGIRKDLSAGPLTKRDLYEVLPFRNVLTTFQLSGAQVRRAVLYYLTKEAPVQFSGIACQWKKKPDGGVEMLSLQIQGRPLDEQRMYTCAASDYFVGEAKRYIGVEIPRVIYLGQTVFEAVENAVRQEKVITPSSQRHFLMVNP
jgi:5'-nucleotidase/UDP-sugar diphosphatase